ncbi:leucine-rich repeat-containing protein Bf66946-like [Branchiostoma floridae x Branchiostoma belcheri]
MSLILFALAIILASATIHNTVAYCPDTCECEEQTVQCIAQNLTSLPEGIPLTTTELILKNNEFKTLDLHVLYHLPLLEGLDISNNKIKTIQGSFEHFPNLETVQLYGNELETLSQDTFGKSVTWITYVSLTQNPWKCDCNMKWMITEMDSESSPFSTQDVKCETPEELHGEFTSDLDVGKLVCKRKPGYVLSQQNILIIAALGASVLIAAVAVAIFYRRQATHGAVLLLNPGGDVVDECAEAREDQSGECSASPAPPQRIDQNDGVDTGPKTLRSGLPAWLQQDEEDSRDVYRSSSIQGEEDLTCTPKRL